MKQCPYCKQELETLGVIIKGLMTLDSVSGYSSVNDVEDTLGYYCTSCGNELDFEFGREIADNIVDEYEKRNF